MMHFVSQTSNRWFSSLLPYLVILTFLVFSSRSEAQESDSPLHIFGYFQVGGHGQFGTSEAEPRPDLDPFPDANETSFSVQQLNLFLQKELPGKWTAFINFELINSFSTSESWGAFNLQEAWVRYRHSEKLNLKAGLQIPEFNHLNTIKNRTPLLPYVVRPLAYETSFREIIAIEEYTPERAFLQLYGFLPFGENKLDYAVYLGNSPNIDDISGNGQSGIDTSVTVLVGGRVGLRIGELKVGVSATHDRLSSYRGLGASLGLPPGKLNLMHRWRTGIDLKFRIGKFVAESEFIQAKIPHDIPGYTEDIHRRFAYATLGYDVSESLLAYATYWYIEDEFLSIAEARIKVSSAGLAHQINDRLYLKGQYARVYVDQFEPFGSLGTIIEVDTDIHIFAIALSVYF